MSKENKKKKNFLKFKWIKAIVLIVLIILIFLFIKNFNFTWNEEGEVSTISEATLKDLIEISDLSTIEYTYNSIVTVRDEEKSIDKYYTSYEGVIKAGIDFSELEIDIDEEEKLVNIFIPQPQIMDVNVDVESLDFIFTKNKYETETVIEEAYRHCVEDLKMKARNEEKIFDLAFDNSKNVVIALVEPWLSTFAEDYVLVVK